MNNNIIETKSFAFAVRIVNVFKHLSSEKKEFIISKQLLRSGTSIGANVAEAIKGQSKADFAAKMCIALKEANETLYWLKLLKETDYLNEKQFESLHTDISELIKLLVSICKTSTQK
ncbi:MAG: four helix bundle protein [Clostridia bacterium]|nr:four helix bundle protein [Clostridia bacterium]